MPCLEKIMTIEEEKNIMSSSSSSNKKEDGNIINHQNPDHHRPPVVHNQVKKIIQESEKDGLEWSPWLQPEIMRGHVVNVRDQKTFTRQHSRSRLGQPIISRHC